MGHRLLSWIVVLALLAPQDVPGLLKSGREKVAAKEYSAALAEADKALALEPKNADALLLRATIFYEMGDIEKAWFAVNQAIGPSWPVEAQFLRGRVFRARGQPKSAITDFDAILKKDPGYAPAYRERGLAKAQMLNPRGALPDLDKAIETDPKDPVSYAERARLRTQLRDLEGGEADLRKALDLNPKYAQAYVLRAIARRELYLYKEAAEDCLKALEIDPKHPNAHIGLGLALRGRGDLAAAHASLSTGLELAPGDAVYWNHRASLRDKMGNIEGALDDYTEALKRGPTAKRHYERGKIRLRMGELPEALSDADAAVKLDPSYAAWHTFRGRVLAARGDHAAAEAEFDKAIALGAPGDNSFRARGLSRLSRRDFDGASTDLLRPARNWAERLTWEEDIDLALEYFGDLRGAIDGSWWVIDHGSRTDTGKVAPSTLRRLEMSR